MTKVSTKTGAGLKIGVAVRNDGWGDCGASDERDVAAAYLKHLARQIRAAYPQADVTVDLSSGSSAVQVIDADGGMYGAVEEDVERLTHLAWDSFCGLSKAAYRRLGLAV